MFELPLPDDNIVIRRKGKTVMVDIKKQALHNERLKTINYFIGAFNRSSDSIDRKRLIDCTSALLKNLGVN